MTASPRRCDVAAFPPPSASSVAHAAAQASRNMVRSSQNTMSAGRDSAASGSGQGESKGVFRRNPWAIVGAQPRRPASARTNSRSETSCAASVRRSARPCSTCSATCGSRRPTSPRSRTRSPEVFPEPELHRRLRQVLRPLPSGWTPTRCFRPLLPQERLRRQGRRRRPRRPKKGTPVAASGGFVPPIAGSTAGCRPGAGRGHRLAAGHSRLVRGLGYGGWAVLQNIQHVVDPSRRSRTCRWRWPRSTPLRVPGHCVDGGARLHRPRRAGDGDRARRALSPAGGSRCRSWRRATGRSPRSTRTPSACSPGRRPGGRARGHLRGAGGAGWSRGRRSRRWSRRPPRRRRRR